MTCSIVEDCSPYYIKFTHEGINNIFSICEEELKKIPKVETFLHYPLPIEVGKQILSFIPFSDEILFKSGRVSMFISAPGYRHYVHIDGSGFSLNYGASILDDLCVTRWYADDDINNNFDVQSHLPWNRVKLNTVAEFLEKEQIPTKSVIHGQGDAIIVNTAKYHDFDNRASSNHRIVLTLRAADNDMSFDDIKKIYFGV